MPHAIPQGADRLLAIGHWGSVDPRQIVDHTWAGNDRARLVQYLTKGRVWHSYMGFSFCRFECGIPRHHMGSTSLTDGIWGWPEGLSHYVESHGIALPDQFLEHARANGFRVLESVRDGELYADETLWEAWAESRGAFIPVRIRELSRERVVAFLDRVSNVGHSVRAGRDSFVLAQRDGDIRIEQIGTVWVVRRKRGEIWYPYGGAANEEELERFLSSALGRPSLRGV